MRDGLQDELDIEGDGKTMQQETETDFANAQDSLERATLALGRAETARDRANAMLSRANKALDRTHQPKTE